MTKATIVKRCRFARHFFAVALRRGIIESNPFKHNKGAVKGNSARRVFVPGEVIDKVMAEATDPQWKLWLALARCGGLRIPSEALALTWQDVDFAGKRFVVRVSKPDQHEDGGIRIVPRFPELVPQFQAVFDQAEVGATHVITHYHVASVNLRTQLLRFITRAGVKPWSKLWQNLRASRATELVDIFLSHVCAAWLGHTEAVADSIYRTVTDSHFEKAIHPVQKAARNPAQQMHAVPGIERYHVFVENCKVLKGNDLQLGAVICRPPKNTRMGDTGFEPVTSCVSCKRSNQLS